MSEQNATEQEVKTPKTVAERLEGNLQAPPEAAAPETPAAPSIVDRVKQLGFQNVEADAEAVDRLVAAYEQERKRAAEAETIARALAADRSAPKAPELNSEEPKKGTWWNPPQVDTALISAFQVQGPDGKPTFRDNTPPEVVQQAEKAAAFYQKWARDIIENPDKVLPNIILSVVEPWFDKKYSSVQQQQQQETVRDQFLRENGEWLFAKDPLTGQAGDLSPDGKKYEGWLTEAAEMGISDFSAQIKYANALRSAELAAAKAAAPAPPAPPAPAPEPEKPVDKRMELLRRATNGTPDRGGSFPAPGATPATPQNRNVSAGDKLLARMRQEGTLLPT